ncbi:MAG TPA: radical SAM protein [Stellaceae bacterium]|nr:radical SAM protein [Stellaceae bacterium]
MSENGRPEPCSPAAVAAAGPGQKRVLIVNAFFDEYWRTRGSPARVPRAMGPVFLAGAFSRELCDVRLYSEQYSGPLHDPSLLAWPDVLVLTGLTASFDRMLHLTAYARALNPAVVVVAGGPAVRALPRRARRFFDYVCLGDIEELISVVTAVLGDAYASETMFPRFDLAPSSGLLGYVESSRYCNFRCGFCSLTAERTRYRAYDLGYIRRQIEATGKKHLVFIDNNFYGNDRAFFIARLNLLKGMRDAGSIRGWSALVTGDFFQRPENLALAREAGCEGLFSGIESFDRRTLLAHNKRQNTLLPQVQQIRSCLEAGIVFTYGIMLDPSSRPLDDLRREIDFILGAPEITLPAYFTLSIPLLGTPYFRDCLEKQLILPSVRLHDMDGLTVVTKPLDPVDDVVAFARDMPNLRGYRMKALRHTARFLHRHVRTLSPLQLAAAGVSAALICTQSTASSPLRPRFKRPRRTFWAPTETLDPLYKPVIRLPSRYEHYFRPTMVTGPDGRLSEDLIADLG